MVEVAYALPNEQLIIPISILPEANAEAAIRASGILNKFPEIDLNENKAYVILETRDMPLDSLPFKKLCV